MSNVSTLDSHAQSRVTARRAGFFRDLGSVALRALRLVSRDSEAVLPALIIPMFFLLVNIGALQSFVEENLPPGFDFKGFQIPVSVVFAVTGISRAGSLVLDVQDGYLDRLLLTPVSRTTLLMGLMVADFVVVILMTVPVLILGALIGVSFATGFLGQIVFVLIAATWGACVHRIPLCNRIAHRQPGGGEQRVLAVLPVRIPHHRVHSTRTNDRLVVHGR